MQFYLYLYLYYDSTLSILIEVKKRRNRTLVLNKFVSNSITNPSLALRNGNSNKLPLNLTGHVNSTSNLTKLPLNITITQTVRGTNRVGN